MANIHSNLISKDADSARSLVSYLGDLLALGKPRITLMTLIVSAGSMALADQGISISKALISLGVIGFFVAGANALNMYFERDFDGLMARTRSRPLPSGRVKPQIALTLGFILSIAAFAASIIIERQLLGFLGLAALAMYVCLYTPLKRTSRLAVVVGSVPGAMPAVMGYCAAANQIDLISLSLFSITFFWQLPHTIAIGIYRKREYENAGYQSIVEALGADQCKLWVVITTLLLVASSFLLWSLDVGGWIYFSAALVLGFWFLFESAAGYFKANFYAWAHRVFRVSLFYQTFLFCFLAIDVLLRHFNVGI